MKYSFVTTVERVFEHRAMIRGEKDHANHSAEAVFTYENRGWFIKLNGSYEALHVGEIEPELKVGDKVKITIERM